MGNSESQQPGSEEDNRSAAAFSEMRTCYYEVLEVERSDSTTADDIKKVHNPFPLTITSRNWTVTDFKFKGLPTTSVEIPS